MTSRSLAAALLFTSAWTLLPTSASALVINLDFSHDLTANGGTGFFESNSTAQAAVTKAAQDISSAILPSLGAVATDVFQGTNGSTTATLNWSMSYTNPSTGATVNVDTFSLAQDSITIYVGMQKLAGSTLGTGGPGGAGVSAGLSGFESEYAGALANAQNNSNAVMPREGGGGSGPIIGTLSGSFGPGLNYSLPYGPLAGNLWFDIDTNNNGAQDTPAELAASWHFDANSAVAGGKNDFYSVALHEILHSIGFGIGQTWDGLENGTTWDGPNAQALNGGSGLNLVTGSGHVREGFMSTTLFGGAAQEAVMDPSILTGTRKFLTVADAAFLKDIGYAVVPEPGSAALLAVGMLALARRRR